MATNTVWNSDWGSFWVSIDGSCYHVLECGDFELTVGNSPERTDVFCRNRNGKLEVIGSFLSGTPERGTGTITVPLQFAQELLQKQTTGCTFDSQVRIYCEGNYDKQLEFMFQLKDMRLGNYTVNNLTNQRGNVQGQIEASIPVDFATDIVYGLQPACTQYTNADETPAAGLEPVDIVWCDAVSCGTSACNVTESDGCRTYFAIYELPNGDIVVNTIHIDKEGLAQDSPKFTVHSQVLVGGVAEYGAPVGGFCWNGSFYLVTDDAVLAKCGDALVRESEAGLVEEFANNIIATSNGYVLYDNNSVAQLTNDGLVQVVADNVAIPQQVDIHSDGESNSFITVGLGDTVANGVSYQVNTGGGVDWSYLPDDLAGVLATSNGISGGVAVNSLWIVYENGSNTYVAQSFNSGKDWRSSDGPYVGVATTATVDPQVCGNFVHIEIDGTVQRNLNKGCKCDWQDVCDGTPIAVCPNDPNKLLVYKKLAGAYFDYGEGINTADIVIDAPANDLAADGCDPLDLTSVLIVDDQTDVDVTVAVDPVTGVITFTPTGGVSLGEQRVTYSITDNCGNVYTADAVAVFTA